MAIMLFGFAYVVPEFTQLFLNSSDARGYFMRGILTEGFFTVFITNAVATIVAIRLRNSVLIERIGLIALLFC